MARMVARFAVYALSVAIVKTAANQRLCTGQVEDESMQTFAKQQVHSLLKVKTINLPNGEPGSLRPPFWIINIEERKLSTITPVRVYGTWIR